MDGRKKKKTFHETKLNEHFHIPSSFPFEIERGGEGGNGKEIPMEKDGMPSVISTERKLMLIGFGIRSTRRPDPLNYNWIGPELRSN